MNQQKSNIVALDKGKIPPQALDLEKAILGALMISENAAFEVSDLLLSEVFYKDAHKFIYTAIMSLFRENKSIDLLTVSQELRETGKLEISGGDFYLIELTQIVGSSAHIEYHSRIILQKYIQRQLIVTSGKLIENAYSEDVDVFDLLDSAYSELNKVTEETIKKSDTTFGELVDAQIQKGRDINNGKIKPGIETPISKLTKKTGGFRGDELIILAARPGMGKAHPFWSKVVTDNGYKLIGDVKVGDTIFDENGEETNITGVFDQGIKDTYKITFSDNTSAYSCKEHLWYVESRLERKKNEIGSVLTLEEISENIRTGSDNRLNYSIPYCKPVQFSKKYCPIDPYLLGLLIGDGNFTSTNILFSNSEYDIINSLNLFIPENNKVTTKDGLNYRFSKSKNGNHKSSIYTLVESLGLTNRKSESKFIPLNYLKSNIEDRISLLQGLLDSDGYVTKGQSNIEYSTVSSQLKDDIIELVYSLGGNANFIKNKGHYTLNGKKINSQDYYRINIAVPNEITPFRSHKHLSKFKPRKSPFNKFIKNIEFVGEHECRCISVDSPNSLYLTNDFIPTHNTSFAIGIALHAAKNGYPAMMFSLEMSAQKLTDRILSMEGRVDSDSFNINGLTAEEETRLQPARKLLKSLPFHIDDSSSLSIEKFQVKAKVAKKKYGIRIIIVDYLQLMSGNSNNREQEISKISRGLKQTAMELHIPIIALSQLSRAVETRGGSKRPLLSDLRESGAIEQDADMVQFLFRPEYYGIEEWDDDDRTPTANQCEYIVAKNRNGGLVRDRMRFEGRYTLFSDLAVPNETDDQNWFDKELPKPSLSDAFGNNSRELAKEKDDDVPF